NTLASAGNVTLAAVQESSTQTTASAKAAGGVAIGAALALALVDDEVGASTRRAIDANGDVELLAMGASFSTLTAEAGATGAPAEEEDEGSGTSGTAGEGDSSVDTQVSDQLRSATDRQSEAGVGSAQQQQASADAAADEE